MILVLVAAVRSIRNVVDVSVRLNSRSIRGKMPNIYLAGPISGLTWYEATIWRDNVSKALSPDITCFSPLRAEHDASCKVLGYNDKRNPKIRGILRRDESDVRRADLVLANFKLCAGISVGTVCELAWAHILNIPTIMICDIGNPHHHDWLIEQVDWTVSTLDEAIAITRKILLP